MENKKKIIYILLSVILLSLFIIVSVIFFNKDNASDKVENEYADSFYIDWDNKENVEFKDGNKFNNSKKIEEDHVYNQFRFVDMKIYTDNGLCNVDFKIVNVSYNNNIQDYGIFIKFLAKDGNIIYVYYYNVPDNFEINEVKEDSFTIDVDVSNSYDYAVSGFREF